MKTQVVVIHGGDTFETYDEYVSFLKNFIIDDLEYFRGKGWKDNLQSDLGDEFDVLVPRMPNKFNARYSEWKIWFEKMIPLLNQKVIFVGHSLGGIFLAKYLSENNFPKEILATFLVAACFDDVGTDYSLVDFKLPSDLSKFRNQSKKVYLYHSKDDKVVDYGDVEKYKKAIPAADIISFEDRGHFSQEHFFEIVKSIKNLK